LLLYLNIRIQGWLYLISGPIGKQIIPRATSYFRMASIDLDICNGSGNEHLQLHRIHWRNELQLYAELCERYKGNLRQYFTDLIRPTEPERVPYCWRAHDGERLCDGHALNFEVILNIPVVLIIEIGTIGKSWDIPSSLYPCPNNSTASAHGVKYSLTSHLYCNTAKSHFITRYSSVHSGKTRIFDYDGKEHEGHAVLHSSGALKGVLTGPMDLIRDIPAGYILHALVYHLDGGEPAQRYFRKNQMEVATKKLGLHFEMSTEQTIIPSSCELRRPHLEKLSTADRWDPLPRDPPRRKPPGIRQWHGQKISLAAQRVYPTRLSPQVPAFHPSNRNPPPIFSTVTIAFLQSRLWSCHWFHMVSKLLGLWTTMRFLNRLS
jgi:hypothetical protein